MCLDRSVALRLPQQLLAPANSWLGRCRPERDCGREPAHELGLAALVAAALRVRQTPLERLRPGTEAAPGPVIMADEVPGTGECGVISGLLEERDRLLCHRHELRTLTLWVVREPLEEDELHRRAQLDPSLSDLLRPIDDLAENRHRLRILAHLDAGVPESQHQRETIRRVGG